MAAVHIWQQSKRNLVQANKNISQSLLGLQTNGKPRYLPGRKKIIRQVKCMKAFDYLNQIRKMDAKINNDIEELESLQTLATKTTSALGSNRVQASGNQQKMADCVYKIMQLKKEIDSEIDAYVDYKDKVRKFIHDVCDADCCRLLYMRYFQFKTWESIATDMHVSYQWVSGKLHKKALSQLQRALDKNL